MNKNLIRIYALIMLECRLSLEDASKMFNIDCNELAENLKVREDGFFQAIKYLYYETSCKSLDNRRGLFKANIYIRRLKRIFNNPNKEELKKQLKELIDDLKGPDISFIEERLSHDSIRYTLEEKELILKYRLKYALSSNRMVSAFHITKHSIAKWEDELPEGDLKIRLGILRDYLNNIYLEKRRK